MSNTKKYGFFQAPLLAFFSKDLYADVAANWKGVGLVYVLFLVAISWGVTCLIFGNTINQMASNQEMKEFLTQIPAMTVVNGKMSIDKPLPYEIKDKSGNVVLIKFVKDYPRMSLTDDDPPVVITEEYMLSSDNSHSANGQTSPSQSSRYGRPAPTQPFPFKRLNELTPEFKLSGKEMQAYVEGATVMAPIVIFITGVFFVAFFHFFQVLVYGGIEFAIASAMGAKITFEAAMRLAAVAMTPVIAIATVLGVACAFSPDVARLVFPFGWMAASIPVALGFLVLAAAGAAKASNPAEQAQ